MAQECLHKAKTRHKTAFFLKLDLEKAYDLVDWSYIRLILVQIGLSPNLVEWIMSVVTSVQYVVLVNGELSYFFKGFRGLRQGCPPSPYVFILAMGGLSLLISQAKAQGSFWGFKEARGLYVTQIIFVDDVLIIGGARIGGRIDLSSGPSTIFM